MKHLFLFENFDNFNFEVGEIVIYKETNRKYKIELLYPNSDLIIARDLVKNKTHILSKSSLISIEEWEFQKNIKKYNL